MAVITNTALRSQYQRFLRPRKVVAGSTKLACSSHVTVSPRIFRMQTTPLCLIETSQQSAFCVATQACRLFIRILLAWIRLTPGALIRIYLRAFPGIKFFARSTTHFRMSLLETCTGKIFGGLACLRVLKRLTLWSLTIRLLIGTSGFRIFVRHGSLFSVESLRSGDGSPLSRVLSVVHEATQAAPKITIS